MQIGTSKSSTRSAVERGGNSYYVYLNLFAGVGGKVKGPSSILFKIRRQMEM